MPTLRTKLHFEETLDEVKQERDDDRDEPVQTLGADADVREEAEKQWRQAVASGEPPAAEDHAAPEAYESDHHWNKERRPPEELHSALGPNLDAAPRVRQIEPL